MRFIFLVLLMAVVFAITSCTDSSTISSDPMDEVVAEEDFMFNTSITVNLLLESTQNGSALGNAYFEILDGMPQEGGNVLLQAYTSDDGTFDRNIVVPVHVTSLVLLNANRDFYELDIERLDAESGQVTFSFDSPFNRNTREAPAWNFNTSVYYATLFSKVEDEDAGLYTDDVNDMFGCFIGNNCIGVTGGSFPGAELLPDNSVLFTTNMYLPDDDWYQLNLRYYDASEDQVYLLTLWEYVQNADVLGSNEDPYTYSIGVYNIMPDPLLLSFSAPGVGQYGMLGYEDNWPQQGDYDINDLVVYGNFTYYVTEMDDDSYSGYFEITYKVAAIGASYQIGFGIQLPEYFEVSNVQSDNGLAYVEADEQTLIIADNVRDCIPGAPSGFVNTDPNAAYFDTEFTTVTFDFEAEDYLRMVFMPPWYEPPYNPFIFVNGDRSHEIHPADYPPTELVNEELWGDEDDTTNPDYDRYYRTENNMPWFFMLPVQAPYPKERASILDAFPYFDDWVENPWSFENWYLDEPGYRNEEYLYSPPGE